MIIHPLRNRTFYQSNRSLPCDCAYCKNYCVQMEETYSEVCEFLKALHIDPRRPFELMPLEPDEHNLLEYIGCQYIVFGECEDTYTQQWNEVVAKKATTHPSTGIDEPHFVLEFSPIRLQWLFQR